MSTSFYCGRRALVTGGLGFIGSNLALRLEELGAQVTVLDSSRPGCGANDANLQGSSVNVLRLDLSEPETYGDVVAATEIVFNLAGEISHIHSMQFPERDLQINTVSQLRFLQCCAERNPGLRILYAGTRQAFGRPQYLPVDEKHPIRPVDFNGVHKYAAAMYHLMMSDLGQINATTLRLTNVYGPRMSLNVFGQGFLGVFVRQSLLGEPLMLYGGGEQLRDPLYIDDAVEAFLAIGAQHDLPERQYNLGGPEPLSLLAIAQALAAATGAPPPEPVPFPAHLQSIDIGSYYTASDLFARDLGWRPQTTFWEGAERTVAFYRERLADYLTIGEAPRKEIPEYFGVRRRLEFL
ncbi:MAG: NAD-dependent epimerase/dehydratase family protein [Bryobacter sp.]|nr:NAD-dependent epimerase/dehydratase family protein [Bryobacter sp.]